jgi:hypothetical protein
MMESFAHSEAPDMGTSSTTSTSKLQTAPGSAIDGLVDELLASYIDWRHAAAAVKCAYGHWADASVLDTPRRFAAYMGALDEEELSAERYAGLLREVERALERETSAAAR